MNKGGPPAVEVKSKEGIIWFDGEPAYRISWDEVIEIGIDINVVEELDYSEAFWVLNDGKFGSPVDMIVGAEELKAKLFSFSGFNEKQFQKALVAEKNIKEGYFLCWQKNS